MEKIKNPKPKENWRKGHNPLIPNEKLEEFKVFVDENNDKTFEELAEKWNGKISSGAIGRAIKRLKYSYKKKL
jgi:transposase